MKHFLYGLTLMVLSPIILVIGIPVTLFLMIKLIGKDIAHYLGE